MTGGEQIMSDREIAFGARRVRVGLVGCGDVARIHAAVMADLPDRYELVAIADPVPEARTAFAERFGVPAAYESQTELLRHEQVDLVILATWPAQHEEQVLEAVAAGVRWILCEKSIAMVPSSVIKMRDAAAAAGATVVEGLMWRSGPRPLRLAELVAEGEIGAVRRMRSGFHFIAPVANNWRADPRTGGGVAYDATCYPVSTFGAFMPGRPTRVSARRVADPNGLVRELDAIIEYDDGGVAFLESSYTNDHREMIEIAGTTAVLSMENAWTSTEDRIDWRDGGLERRVFTVVPASPWLAQLEHLYLCITEGATPRISIDESLRNVTLLCAVLEAAEAGRSLDMDEVTLAGP
jgi:predicted dehydrogenase